MSEAVQLHCGDVLDVLRTLPAESVHCVVTSPPYWGLRDYGVDGQIGLERTPSEYAAKMVAVFGEVRRVLRGDGVCWLNLGDSYGAVGGDTHSGFNQRWNGTGGEGSKQDAMLNGVKDRKAKTGLKPKDLVGIPWRVAFALQEDGWWLRQDIIWHKPNPMPESVQDRCTKAHEYVFMLTKSGRYYFDNEAIKEPSVYGDGSIPTVKRGDYNGKTNGLAGREAFKAPSQMRNCRSVWCMPVGNYKEAHFATFPESLPERCILAGTSAHGCCDTCGAPWRRVVERERKATRPGADTKVEGVNGDVCGNRDPLRHVAVTRTTGWVPTCKCDAGLKPCVVLDPFAGSGTTLAVAYRLGRNAVGIELNEKYADMARRRVSEQTDKVALFDDLGETEGKDGEG